MVFFFERTRSTKIPNATDFHAVSYVVKYKENSRAHLEQKLCFFFVFQFCIENMCTNNTNRLSHKY